MLLKTNRTFGVEIELGFPTESTVYAVRDRLSGNWNLTRDGSLRCDNPIEVVSPILSGDKGMSEVKKVCEVLKKHNGNPDHPSCGMHVHHGAKDMLPSKEDVLMGAEEYNQFKNEFSGKFEYAITMPAKVVRVILGIHAAKLKTRDYMRVYEYALNRVPVIDCAIGSVYQSETFKVLYHSDKNIGKMFMVDRKLYDTLYKQKQAQLLELGEHDLYQDMDRVEDDFRKKILSLCEDTDSKHIVRVIKEGNFEGLKRVLYFYTMFSPVMQSMVQDSRKIGNMYCIGLRDSFDLKDIYKLKSIDELEKLWYKTTSNEDIRSQKRQHYNDSRYHEVNFHSLWYKYGTIEIRSHASTIDWRQIMLWTAFHQHIIEACASGEVTLEQIKEAEKLTDVREMTLFMLSILKLPYNIEKYVRRLVNYFAILKEPL